MKIFAVVVLGLLATVSANPLIGSLLGGGGGSEASSGNGGGLLAGATGDLSGLTGSLGAVTGAVGGLTSGLGGLTSGIGGLTSGLGGITNGLAGAVSGITTGVVGLAGGLIEGAVGVISGVTLLAGGLVAGVVGALNEVLSALLIAFTNVLSSFDVTGILKGIIKTFTTSVVNITSGMSLFGSSTDSVSSGSTTSVSGSTSSTTNVSSSVINTGNGSLDFAILTTARYEKLLQRILGIKSLESFDLGTVISGLVEVVLQLTVVLGKNITGAYVQVFNQILALTQAIVKATITKDFQSIEGNVVQLIYTLNVLLDLFVTVLANVSAGSKGTTTAVSEVFTVANALSVGMISLLFTAIQTVTVAVQGTLYQYGQDIDSTKGAQVVLDKLLNFSELIIKQVGEFIGISTIFAKDNGRGGDYLSKLNAAIVGFTGTLRKSVTDVTAALSSITGITVTASGQLAASVFSNFNIYNELIQKINFVVGSATSVSYGLFGLIQASGSATYNG